MNQCFIVSQRHIIRKYHNRISITDTQLMVLCHRKGKLWYDFGATSNDLEEKPYSDTYENIRRDILNGSIFNSIKADHNRDYFPDSIIIEVCEEEALSSDNGFSYFRTLDSVRRILNTI